MILAFVDMVVNHCQVSRAILQLSIFGNSVFDSSVFLQYLGDFLRYLGDFLRYSGDFLRYLGDLGFC